MTASALLALIALVTAIVSAIGTVRLIRDNRRLRDSELYLRRVIDHALAEPDGQQIMTIAELRARRDEDRISALGRQVLDKIDAERKTEGKRGR